MKAEPHGAAPPPPPAPGRAAGVAFSLAAALCSAAYLFPYKRAAALAPPRAVALGLLLVAAAASSLLQLWQRRGGPEPRRDARTFWATSAALALLAIAGNLCGAQAVARLEPAVTSVVLRTEVVFVGVLGACWLGEAVTLPLAMGAAVALAGLVVMRWPLALDSAGAGALWALGGAASFATMQVLTRRVIARISPVAVNTCRLWLAVALWSLMPGVAAAALRQGAEFWAFITAAGVLGPFLGRLFIMYSLRSLRAASSALLLLLAPVFAFAIGFVGFGAVPAPHELCGAALVLLGVALPPLARLRAERPPP